MGEGQASVETGKLKGAKRGEGGGKNSLRCCGQREVICRQGLWGRRGQRGETGCRRMEKPTGGALGFKDKADPRLQT